MAVAPNKTTALARLSRGGLRSIDPAYCVKTGDSIYPLQSAFRFLKILYSFFPTAEHIAGF